MDSFKHKELAPELRPALQALLMGLLCLVSASCTLPPDVFSSPDPGPAPDVPRDTSLSGVQPIDSLILEQAEKSPDAHECMVLEDADDALLARIHLIRAARESIDLQTFIWVYDRSGSWVFRELLEAARRGVRVRILIDQVVPPRITAGEYAALVTAHENLEVRLFRPLTEDAINTSWTFTQTTFTRYATLNRRMHNKVLLVDGKVAIVGGRNYQDAYYDRDPEFNFIDRDVLFSGPSVGSVGESFEEFWDSRKSIEASRMWDLRRELEQGRARLPETMSGPVDPIFAELDDLANRHDISLERPTLQRWRVARIEYLSDTPGKLNPLGLGADRDAFDPLISIIRSAGERIAMQSPYVVMGKTGFRLFRDVHENNPDLRIEVITNSLSSTDNVYAAGISLKQRRMQIEDLGFELYVSRPEPGGINQMSRRYPLLAGLSEDEASSKWLIDDTLARQDSGLRFCLHAKSIVVDHRFSFIGSHNFDPRSFSLNTECGVLIEDEAFSIYLDGLIRRMMEPQNSWVVAVRDLPPVVSELNAFISRISSQLPMFDIWPLEHTSCYELKQGAEPVPTSDPEFHDRFRDVGPVPGLNISLTTVQAQLIRSFAGFAAPLM